LASDLTTALSFAKTGRTNSKLGKYKVVQLCRVALAESVTRQMDKKEQRGISSDSNKTPANYYIGELITELLISSPVK
jgi:hypothetical protein